MAVVSAEAQRALELWVNKLRSELRDTRAELHEAKCVANELVAERESQKATRAEQSQQDHRTEHLEKLVRDSTAECQRLREELAEMARLCKSHEQDVRDLRAEIRGEHAKAALLRDERRGRGTKKSALSEQLQAAQEEVVELRQEIRARNAEVRHLRSQRDRDTARRAQEQKARKELRLAIKEIAAVVDGVTAQMRNTENRHAALPLGAPNPAALERVLGRLRTALRIGPDSTSNEASDPPANSLYHEPAVNEQVAEPDEQLAAAYGPSPAVSRTTESERTTSRRQRRSSTWGTRPRTTARQQERSGAEDGIR